MIEEVERAVSLVDFLAYFSRLYRMEASNIIFFEEAIPLNNEIPQRFFVLFYPYRQTFLFMLV